MVTCKCVNLGSLRATPGLAIPVLEIGRGASPDVFYVQLLLLQG